MIYSDFFSSFFVIEDPASKKNYRGQIVNEFDEFGQLLRGECEVEHLDIKYLAGSSEPNSIFWNQVSDPFCINEHLVNILQHNNITGWKAIPTTSIDQIWR